MFADYLRCIRVTDLVQCYFTHTDDEQFSIMVAGDGTDFIFGPNRYIVLEVETLVFFHVSEEQFFDYYVTENDAVPQNVRDIFDKMLPYHEFKKFVEEQGVKQ